MKNTNTLLFSFGKVFLIINYFIFLEEIVSAQGLHPNSYSPNIVRITNDSLILASGTTRLFSVDAPDNQGDVSTLVSINQLSEQLIFDRSPFKVYGRDGKLKTSGVPETGDMLQIMNKPKRFTIGIAHLALNGKLEISRNQVTTQLRQNLTIRFTAGQRTPDATVKILLPSGISFSKDNIYVNVIGRGKVKLSNLESQSIGRAGSHYSYTKVANVEIFGNVLTFSHVDLRPSNGADFEILFKELYFPKNGVFTFKAFYTTAEPENLASRMEIASVTARENISDLERLQTIVSNPDAYTQVFFKWTPVPGKPIIRLMKSMNDGQSWDITEAMIDPDKGTASVCGLESEKLYSFRLQVIKKFHKNFSNTVKFYSGRMDIKSLGVTADGKQDNTELVNKAIEYLHKLGGGTLLFSEGIYNVRTVDLKSNVWLYIKKGAVIRAMKGSYEPETKWFSSRMYRSGLSPTDKGPYMDPENFLTKQDVGHTYFQNTMFYGERVNNVKIIGNGRISGNGCLNTSDKVMENESGNRADKMFTFKLSTNIEVGGIFRSDDLWYNEKTDEPFYSSGNSDTDNMLDIDQAGHFVLLATGTDSISVHDVYQGRNSNSNVRDVLDFMGCSEVRVANIYCRVSSDDIVKLGSDCSLGFTRPAKDYKIRNIIGDTNCNLFQIGSETADDITDVCVDNIYVLGANKAGFSISTNDGGHLRNIHLNCGHTGSIHSRSKMLRTTTPFFISISNRGRVLGADVERYRFMENGSVRDELLCTNVNIGKVENVILIGVDVSEVYSGSSFRGERWKAFDGSQKRASPIIAGYELPETQDVEGGLNFMLPDGNHTGYISHLMFEDVHVLVKGGNPATDTASAPRELGVGQYNVSNLGIQPSYGLWARHVKNLSLVNCSFKYETPDYRFPLFFDDVIGARISSVKMMVPKGSDQPVRLLRSSGVVIEKDK